MQRIIISLLLVVGITASLAVGATNAFFSDTEESSGNTFAAGSIDLKVDHTKQTYNGEECQNNCVVQEQSILLPGSGFEAPEVNTAQNWDIFDSPAGAWTVEWRSDVPASFGNQTRPTPAHLELHEGVLGAAAEGDQYAELDSDWGGPTHGGTGEPASITIYQDVPTVAGRQYKIRFIWAARPNTIAAENRIEVGWGGTVAHDTGNLADPNAGITWIPVEVSVTATTTSTRLSFTDRGTANSLGSFLDHIRLHEVICETQIGGGQCRLWEEKDLGEGDKFWNFNDVKPGDRGTNVISLHVFDNDAFACVLTEDIADNENTWIEPEQSAGDDDDGPVGEGELAQFLDLFIWSDDNDGLYETGETALYEGPFSSIPQTMQRFALTATTTAYLGVSWCFGDQTVNNDPASITCNGTAGNYNVSQTDSVTANLSFYATQQRNNSDFQCSSLLKVVEVE